MAGVTCLHLTVIGCQPSCIFSSHLHKAKHFLTFWRSHCLLGSAVNPTIPHASLAAQLQSRTNWKCLLSSAQVDMYGHTKLLINFRNQEPVLWSFNARRPFIRDAICILFIYNLSTLLVFARLCHLLRGPVVSHACEFSVIYQVLTSQ